MRRFPSVKKNTEFRSIYQNGRSAAGRYMVMYTIPNGLFGNRLGVSVSKKIGNSVVRHGLVRKMREIFRLNDSKTVQGNDIVIILRNHSVNAGYFSLEKEYLRLLKDHKLRIDEQL